MTVSYIAILLMTRKEYGVNKRFQML